MPGICRAAGGDAYCQLPYQESWGGEAVLEVLLLPILRPHLLRDHSPCGMPLAAGSGSRLS